MANVIWRQCYDDAEVELRRAALERNDVAMPNRSAIATRARALYREHMGRGEPAAVRYLDYGRPGRRYGRDGRPIGH